MSFLKRLFGGGRAAEGGEVEVKGDPVDYKGYRIMATPFAEGGQFQTCGVISKEFDGEVREHRFIRADRFASQEDAVSVSLRKAQQLIDEQGDRLFG